MNNIHGQGVTRVKEKMNDNDVKKLLGSISYINSLLPKDKVAFDVIFLANKTGWGTKELRDLSYRLDGKERKALSEILGPSLKNPTIMRLASRIVNIDEILSTRHLIEKNGELIEIPKEELERMYYYLVEREIEVNYHHYQAMLRRYRTNKLPKDFVRENYEQENVKAR